MTVRELIELLSTYDPNLPVCYGRFSEQCMLEAKDMRVEKLGEARPDGWVADARPDKTSIDWLVFPGN